jgi:hypothetical protein
MKKLLIFVFLLSTIDSYCQMSSLTVDFYPSFIKGCQLKISKDNSNYSVSISNTKINEVGIVPDSLISDLKPFLDDYFVQKFTLDSLKKVEEQRNWDDNHFVDIPGLDGITVKGVMVDNSTEKSFSFWSPGKGSIDHDLIIKLFNLMNTSFSKSETIVYIEQLEGYFSFGLGLKKLKEDPLTYKLYGVISFNEEKELLDFLNSLPTDKEIYIDMSNFEGMGTMFYDDFKTLCSRNQRIYWINCSDFAKKNLTNAGIMSTNIR